MQPWLEKNDSSNNRQLGFMVRGYVAGETPVLLFLLMDQLLINHSITALIRQSVFRVLST